ncbi:hypothetical protein [Endozoicomonas sp. SCSIO W0465]|uniref:hypothetical protein n=1 Tax=Endozoicomonas sp. SCSIO W0465 TaxID=2918516 RepID=UPI002075F32B|nr:hypothetical protein [Endozoicomonas sp. SCSIO W0465]USE35086.1 hypothetical protein MJO57_23695 [Endozoicomonas sp. SCSIO W0465]
MLPTINGNLARFLSKSGLIKIKQVALFVLQTADFINQAGILLWQGLAIFSQQFPEGIVYQGLWPIFIAEQSVTRKEPNKFINPLRSASWASFSAVLQRWKCSSSRLCLHDLRSLL